MMKWNVFRFLEREEAIFEKDGDARQHGNMRVWETSVSLTSN